MDAIVAVDDLAEYIEARMEEAAENLTQNR
jgi:hypothetical protein